MEFQNNGSGKNNKFNACQRGLEWKNQCSETHCDFYAGHVATPFNRETHSHRQIAFDDNESLPSNGKVKFPKILPPTTLHLWNPGSNLIHRVVAVVVVVVVG